MRDLIKKFIKAHSWSILLALALGICSMLIFLGYHLSWRWMGVSTKTFWDWLQLFIVPAVLAIGSILYAHNHGENERRRGEANQEAAEKQRLNQQREDALQHYFTALSDLLLNKDLVANTKAQVLAQAHTVATLRMLDPVRRGMLLRFLSDAKLIDIGICLESLRGIDLHETDLSNINLRGAKLSRADLHGSKLICTNLSDAKLDYANLSGAHLNMAHLSGSNLSNADLSYANLQGSNIENAQCLERTKLYNVIGLTDKQKEISKAMGALLNAETVLPPSPPPPTQVSVNW